jgi:hypothetical protein
MVSSYICNLSRNLDWYAEWLIQGNLTPYKKKGNLTEERYTFQLSVIGELC